MIRRAHCAFVFAFHLSEWMKRWFCLLIKKTSKRLFIKICAEKKWEEGAIKCNANCICSFIHFFFRAKFWNERKSSVRRHTFLQRLLASLHSFITVSLYKDVGLDLLPTKWVWIFSSLMSLQIQRVYAMFIDHKEQTIETSKPKLSIIL